MKLRPIIKHRIKKSGFEDAFFVLAVIFAIVIFVIILAKVWGDIHPALDEGLTGALPAGSGTNITDNFAKITSTMNMFDSLFPLLLIGLFALALIGGGSLCKPSNHAFCWNNNISSSNPACSYLFKYLPPDSRDR